MRPLAETPLTDLTVDFGTRPKSPVLPEANESHRRQGRMLGVIHRQYLQSFEQISEVLFKVENGSASPHVLVDEIANAQLTLNMRQFGTLCGRQCKLLLMHHDAEEQLMFPQIASQNNPQLRSVIERLRAEHMVVSELILRLQDVANRLVADPASNALKETKAVFSKLQEVVVSHFDYEETQLETALGLYVKAM